jgi:hypothetical protein
MPPFLVHEFVLIYLISGGYVALTTYPTFKDCMSAREYYISAGLITRCVRREE